MNIPKKASKSIVITGVSTGIGWGITQQFIRHGYRVFGSVRQQADGLRLQADFGPLFTPLHFDVTDGAALERAVQLVETELAHTGLGGLINNAGIAVSGPLSLQPIDEIRHHFEVNTIGVLSVTQAFLPLLAARTNHPVAPGRILNISSVGGQLAGPFIGAYHGSKFALEGISHTLRRELQLYGIDVVIIGPGSVITPIWDKGVTTKPYDDTAYGPSMRSFVEYFVREGRHGYAPGELGEQVVRIFETARPRTRYALVKGRLQNWIIPRLLPARWLDRLIGRITGLAKLNR